MRRGHGLSFLGPKLIGSFFYHPAGRGKEWKMNWLRFLLILFRSSGISSANHFHLHSFDQKLVTLPHLTSGGNGMYYLAVCSEVRRNRLDGNIAVSSITHIHVQVYNLSSLTFPLFSH